ncbi:MAG: RNA polymerase sigma factor RpoE [Gammaproteobacteria bacterium]|nr:RNA polymerase sigma factor RpoE [Gammaproteobacteria bacterium]
MADNDSDEVLVARVQQGDKAAFDLLVLKYQHRLTNLISRYVRDQSEVLDIAQEAFLRAYRALPGFRGDSAFYTWLYRIAINTAKNHLLASSRRVVENSLDADDAERFEADSDLKDHASPERLLLTEEIRRTVVEVIDGLPEDLRTAILLREMDGLSYEEIAQAMACPVGTVRSRIFRAREAINERLAPLLEQ